MPNIKVDNIVKSAEIEEDTTLFRIVSPGYATKKFLLNGKGSKIGEGRYHRIQQLASYVSDNIILCIAEKLFHMLHQSVKKLRNNSYGEFKKEAHKDFVIVVFKCYKIMDIVNIDSSEAYHLYQLNPSITTHPDCIYEPLHRASDTMRNNSNNGIVSYSARHSKGLSACLFWDNTSNIKSINSKLKLKLTLVSEDKTLVSDPTFDPTTKRLNYKIGYFEIDNNDFRTKRYTLFPILSDSFGYIDIGRFDYNNVKFPYPDCAMKIKI